ncbi:hypothetical protein [Sphingobacterium sp. SYP-B4668]|uniref:hypothetical protein n=1 Tax=Sphingobacterium sp. SYP-B4668 TaxID=2996035 RepID=UPI0022DE3AF3|nr:hypothetical protein [Sphingobacterium sp. SYP-B4668]
MEKKKKYVPPKIELAIIELESSVAAASAQIVLEKNGVTPQIEDWEEKKDEKFWDF